ncbi:hypothetical protein NLU14_20745 [Marinobacter sp. 71-i]|uniref:Uncharacterized protein n=1 Tax=Marinobacter iranensis TaxID=2962607 RepID=A0ABT5YG29_9GAMM|nr:hypothetical protein [Marinobacter iranensis]MDF0752661.1 hypothetical protein [Marinobacter iranensis]
MKEYFEIIKTKKMAYTAIISGSIILYWALANNNINNFKVILPIVTTTVFSISFIFVELIENAYKKLPTINKKLFTEIPKMNAKQETIPPLIPQSSTVLFSERFSLAFPGVRGVKWYSGSEAIRRLEILLKHPLTFSIGESTTDPIWWWRGGNLQISDFKRISKDVVLLNTLELKIKRIAAIKGSDYYRSFVYVESTPMKRSGASEIKEKQISEQLEDQGFAREDYAIVRKKPFPIEHYEDGATEINGKLVDITNIAERRSRFLTPYNLVIAPHKSPINNTNFDDQLRKLLDSMLSNKASIEDLKKAVESQPKLPHHII